MVINSTVLDLGITETCMGGKELGVENWEGWLRFSFGFCSLITSVHASYLPVTLIGQVNVLHKTR